MKKSLLWMLTAIPAGEFNVQRSTFNVQRSTSNVQRSTFNVPPFDNCMVKIETKGEDILNMLTQCTQELPAEMGSMPPPPHGSPSTQNGYIPSPLWTSIVVVGSVTR